MIGLLQRVSRASVTVNNQIVGNIELGLLVLVGIQRNDAAAQAKRLLERLLTYRVFEDEAGRMNLDVRQVNGGLLLVPQFTLAANNRFAWAAASFRCMPTRTSSPSSILPTI